MIATRRAPQRHPAREYRWTSEEATHAFFPEQRLCASFATAGSPCEPFLLPPNTEIRSPRLHHPAFEQSASEPAALLRKAARCAQRTNAAARHGVAFYNSSDSARGPYHVRASCFHASFRPPDARCTSGAPPPKSRPPRRPRCAKVSGADEFSESGRQSSPTVT